VRDRFERAQTFSEFLASAVENRELWAEIYRRAQVSEAVIDRAVGLRGPWRFLVLLEDWCVDAASSIPYLARLVETVPSFELRLLSRDDNPDLMDAHLTGGSRSMPVVIILNEDWQEVAWWGPRPVSLQEWFLRELKPLPKPERTRRIRGWYAQDRGETTLGEILSRIPRPV
jgi:hypothetical protein